MAAQASSFDSDPAAAQTSTFDNDQDAAAAAQTSTFDNDQDAAAAAQTSTFDNDQDAAVQGGGADTGQDASTAAQTSTDDRSGGIFDEDGRRINETTVEEGSRADSEPATWAPPPSSHQGVAESDDLGNAVAAAVVGGAWDAAEGALEADDFAVTEGGAYIAEEAGKWLWDHREEILRGSGSPSAAKDPSAAEPSQTSTSDTHQDAAAAQTSTFDVDDVYLFNE